MSTTDSRAKLIASVALSKGEIDLLRPRTLTAAATTPVAQTQPNTPRFDFTRTASALLLTLFDEKAEAAVAAANGPASGLADEPNVGNEQNRAAVRASVLYAMADLDGPERLSEQRDIPLAAPPLNAPSTTPQASIAAQTLAATAYGPTHRETRAAPSETQNPAPPVPANLSGFISRNGTFVVTTLAFLICFALAIGIGLLAR